MTDVTKMSVEELTAAVVENQGLIHSSNKNHPSPYLDENALAALNELHRRSSLYEELREALTWMSSPTVCMLHDHCIVAYVNAEDEDDRTLDADWTRNPAEPLADFIVRAYRESKASPLPNSLSGTPHK